MDKCIEICNVWLKTKNTLVSLMVVVKDLKVLEL